MLDFGSGSGILAIAAARLGAKVDAIEIDPLAASHGERNALANAVADRVDHARTLGETRGAFDFIVANILRSVILDFADALTSRLAKQATLVLSGLVSTDVPEVSARYASQLGTQRPEVYERGDWRALVWRNLGDVGAPEVQSCAASSATLGRTTHSVGSKRDRAEKPDNGQGEHG
jgi:ribosomal protein L11 methyltransferase